MQQLQIAQEEEARIQSTQEEFEFITAADAHEETRDKVTALQRIHCSKHPHLELTYNDMQTKIEWLQAQLGDLKGKSSDTQCASNTIDPLSQKLEDENVSLEFQVLSYAKENAHLKTTYKNMFDSIKVTQAQTNSIIDYLQKQLYDTIYENAKLRAQLFDKVSEPKGTTKGTRTNTMFKKQSILGKPPSSYKPKLYSVTPFPKSSVLPKVDKTNALSKPVTSNSAPSTQESKVVQTVNVIAPRFFRTNPSKNSRNNVKKIEENHRNSQIPMSQKHMSSKWNNITLAIRNAKSKIVCVMCKQCLVTANHDVCVLNYVNDMNSRADNQSANVLIRENQKKHTAYAKKLKELGSKESLASSRPSKPRTCLSTSNPLEPSSKGFLNSPSLLSRSMACNHVRLQPVLQLGNLSVTCSSTNNSNGENQVVSKSSVVTTADASDKRQQQQDSTSSTSTLATTITADGNFDL
ncbi:hypothetical protein Tco_0765141 [Tanacetum coccineum]